MESIEDCSVALAMQYVQGVKLSTLQKSAGTKYQGQSSSKGSIMILHVALHALLV